MKTTITAFLATAVLSLALSALQPALAQEYYGGGDQGQQGNPFGQPANPPGSQVVQFVDQNSPYGPVVAFEHAIPPGWQAGGQVIWNQRSNYMGCGYDDVHYRWAARSPDGSSELGYFPQVIYSGYQSQFTNGNPNRGCENVIIGDPKAFLTAHVQRVRRGAQIKSYKVPTPQEYAQLRQIMPPTQRMGPGVTGAWDIIAGFFIVTYQDNGATFDEYMTVSAVILNLQETGSFRSHTQITSVLPTYYMRAREGRLDEKVAMAYGDSMRANPAYLQMLKSISEKKANQNAQRMIAQSKARVAASQLSSSGSSGVVDFSTADIQAAGWKRRNAISDASQTKVVAGLGGVVRYNDPQSNTGYYETQIGDGERVFRQDDGSTVVTDDYFYNSGTQLTLAR